MDRPLAVVAFVLGLSGCASQGSSTSSAPSPATPADPVEVTVVALSDFHGWLSPRTTRSSQRFYGGIEHIAASLEHREGVPRDRMVVVDNGDMWTGPTESTFLRGAPVIEAYNLLGVSAANVANHEFDFGRAVLEQRAREAKFPFLGANIVEKATGTAPWFVQPWVVVERAGVRIGIVGLSYVGTPQTTRAKHVEGLEFQPYAPTLLREVPRLREAGAQIVVVLLHDTPPVGRALVREVGSELELAVVVAGQDHRKSHDVVDGIPVVNPGPFGTSYGKFVLRVDRAHGTLLGVTSEIVDVAGSLEAPPYPPPEAMTAVVDRAKARTSELANQKLGRLARPLPVGGFEASPLGQMVVDSWLSALGEKVDFALLNHGALRQPLPSGEVSLGDLIGALPFENNLYIIELTGLQIASQLQVSDPVVGGFTWTFSDRGEGRIVRRIIDPSGQPVVYDKTYRVAILDFMYTGGDGYRFSALDDSPVDTGLSWRDPVVRALREADEAGRALDPRTQPRALRE